MSDVILKDKLLLDRTVTLLRALKTLTFNSEDDTGYGYWTTEIEEYDYGIYHEVSELLYEMELRQVRAAK